MTSTVDSRLVVSNLTKVWPTSRGSVQALDDINVEVRAEEFVCILGPSGCGKSTLLEIIAGLESPTSGTVLHDKVPVTAPGPSRGMVFQQAALFPWRTALGNIEFGLQATGQSRNARRKRAEELLDMVGLTEFMGAYPRELSGGMAQRVAVARALANSPDVLLMDEPFGALDAQTREILQREIIRVWQQTHATILFVTHSVQEAVFLADRVIVMSARPGRIRQTVGISMEHPRDMTAPDFGAHMRRLYDLLKPENDDDEGENHGVQGLRRRPAASVTRVQPDRRENPGAGE